MTWGRRKRAGRFTAHTIINVALAGIFAATLLTTPAIARSQPPASTTIALTSTPIEMAGAANVRQLLSYLEARNGEHEGVSRRLVALPECDGAIVESVTLSGVTFSGHEAARFAWIEDVVMVREQAVAVVAMDSHGLVSEQARLGLPGDISVTVEPLGSRGATSRNVGPFTRACEAAILNYGASAEAAPVWQPPAPIEKRSGVATYCYSVEDCAAAGTDLLVVVADELHSSPVLFAFANHHAAYLGLNVSVVGTSALTDLSAEALKQFIQDVYETQSAEHFGDGRLGFVTLIGDAYADDNSTVMIPTYDGYGNTEVASDHYYACVSGDDDFEDVMIGRLSVGNVGELVSVIGKNANYMPQPEGEEWCESTLLVAGLFYTVKEEYVRLFDEYDELMPDGWTVDRIYRHDYANNHLCSLDVVDAFDEGHLFVNFAGDGWISSWHQVMDTTDIPQMSNGGKLPIVLSMACNTGWYDNTTEVGPAGSYDCFAEQIVNASGRGAIACVAAPRASDGGMFRTLTKSIYRAAFAERSVFLGETLALAKLLHLQDGGDVDYTRHFNLFGDPALIYRWTESPTGKPELNVRPHEVVMTPELPAEGEDLTLEITVRNSSTQPTDGVLVRVSDTSEAGTLSQDIVVPALGAWSLETVTAVIPALPGSWHLVGIEVDPDRVIEEIDEANNVVSMDVYVYPHLVGFPAEAGTDILGPCLAALDGLDTHIFVMEGEAQVRAIAPSGQTAWLTDPATAPVDYGPEVAPAVGDLDGDGLNEVIATRRMGLAAFNSEGQQLWSIITDDPIGSPVLADADADGDLDVLLATKLFFGGTSKIIAVNESGGVIWSYSMPSGDAASATPAVGDFDLDGFPDFAFGTQGGVLGAASCSQTPPVQLWEPVQLGEDPIASMGLADLDSDGILEIAAIGDDVYARNSEDGSECWTADLDATVVSLAIGDVDSDGDVDVVAGTAGATLYLLFDGTPAWSTTLQGLPLPSMAIADLRDDDAAEIVVQTDDGSVHLFNSDGDCTGDHIPVPDSGSASPFVADLDDDGRPEVCVSSAEGHVFVFGFEGIYSDPVIEWQGPGGNPARSGRLVQPFSGSISSGATLHGRYLITGDVVLEQDASVTILPGTDFEFDGDTAPSMEVRGDLRVLGLPGAPVTLGSDEERDSTRWSGLNLKMGSTTTLSSCVISGAAIGIRGSQASLEINDCTVLDAIVGARLTGCTIDVSGSSFSAADSLGMYLSGGSGVVSDCVFDGNAYAGMWCEDYATHELVRNLFTNTTAGDGVRFYRYANASVDTCEISGNAGHGAVVHSASPAFTNCTITDNALNGMLCRRVALPTICWSTISGNTIGVSAETGAMPNLGDSMNDNTGFNSIMGNPVAAVANYTDSEFPVEIRENWWGAYPPVGRIFVGYVRYYPCLEAPPVHGTGGRETAVIDEALEPTAFRLGHCSPNPFNPVTTVDFDVPASDGFVDVSVFDVAGRRITTLYSGHHDPGTHTVTWDGRDERGRNVASGIYFVHLNAGDFRASRKMVLLK